MMMTLCRALLLVSVFVPLAGAVDAAPGPADFGAAVVDHSPLCTIRPGDPLKVVATTAAHPCCTGHLHCSQYLATTRIGHVREQWHT